MKRPRTDAAFLVALAVLGGSYVALIAALLVADVCYTSPGDIAAALASPEIRYSVRLSLAASGLSAMASLVVAVPLGYLLARTSFRGKALVEALVDVPVVLPPLVLGLSLLILFQSPPGRAVQQFVPVTFAVPAVILAQFTAAAAFAVRAMRVAFEQASPRTEHVALTLGCTRAQAFWYVALPEVRRGIVAAGTLAWARSLGEFGPVLVFAGATRFKTEVLATSVFIELGAGNICGAVAVSLVMVVAAALVLTVLRAAGLRGATGGV